MLIDLASSSRRIQMDEAQQGRSNLDLPPPAEQGLAEAEKEIQQTRKTVSNKQYLLLVLRNLLIMYLAFGCVIMSPVYTMVALRPDRSTSAPLYSLNKILNASREEFFFAAATGEKLHGWLLRTPGSDHVVIVHHGNAGNILNRLFIAKHLIQHGSAVFLYDYRGYGKSDGKADLSHLTEDGLSAYDFVSKNLKFAHIVNYGESIGSHVAAATSRDRPCDGVILQSGISSLPAVAKNGPFFMSFYPEVIFPKPYLDNLAVLPTLKMPKLIMHGEKDSLVPFNHSAALYACAPEPRKLVKLPSCGHNDVGGKDEKIFDDALSQFLDSLYGTVNKRTG